MSALLDRARKKAYRRLLPSLFVCFVIPYVDRVNVSVAKPTMSRDMAALTDESRTRQAASSQALLHERRVQARRLHKPVPQ